MHSCAFSTVLWKLQSSISIAHALSMWLLDYEITIHWQGLLSCAFSTVLFLVTFNSHLVVGSGLANIIAAMVMDGTCVFIK